MPATARLECPSFIDPDDALLAEWDEEPIPPYVRVGALARHLVDLAATGDASSVGPALGLVERAIEEGDAYVQELAVVGLLEDVQNLALQTSGAVRLIDLWTLLGPRSAKAWDELMSFWHGTDGRGAKGSPSWITPGWAVRLSYARPSR